MSARRRALAAGAATLAAAAAAACGDGGTDLAELRIPPQAILTQPLPPVAPGHGATPAFGVSGGPWALLAKRDPRQVATLMRRAGATVLRLEVPWYAVQADERARPDLSAYARLTEELRRNGIKPLLLLDGTPRWALPPAWGCPTSAVCDGPPVDERLGDLARYVRATVRAFPEAIAVEVGNEVNTAVNFGPRADPARYVRVLRTVRRAVRTVRKVPVLTAGLVNGTQGQPGDLDAPDFLDAVYEAGGKGAFDGVGVHPYAASPDPSAPRSPWRTRLAAVRAVTARHGDGRIPLWITESGWPTSGRDGWTPVVSEEEQSRLERCELQLLIGRRDVRVVLHNLLFDTRPPDPNGSLEDHWGLVRADGIPKPIVDDMGRLLRGNPQAVRTCVEVT